jgi:hypothetical protein
MRIQKILDDVNANAAATSSVFHPGMLRPQLEGFVITKYTGTQPVSNKFVQVHGSVDGGSTWVLLGSLNISSGASSGNVLSVPLTVSGYRSSQFKVPVMPSMRVSYEASGVASTKLDLWFGE